VKIAALAIVCSVFVQPLYAAGLTSPELLAKAYQLILDARFEDAERQLKQACGDAAGNRAPLPACEVLGAVSGYWQVLLDPENTSRDAALMKRINASIASAEAWAAREPGRAEAWFYLGGSYGTRVLLRGLRAQYLAAARDGKRIHDSLQQSVRLDPTLQDAYFGLGLYHYYAAIAPTAARVLRFLLLLPGGDRAGGLREMEQTRSRGMLLREEADYQLHLIYLWYERQPMTALRLIEGLRARYPHNPIFPLRLATVQSDYLRNHRAALDTYRALFDAARAGRVAAPAMSEVHARLGMAHEMDMLCDTERAIEQLRAVVAQKPAAPYAAIGRAHYQLGVVYDRTGRRSDAIDAYQRALAALPVDDRLTLVEKTRAALKRPPAARACR
jgi:tetratricopeptide (TPR) repeat protein